MVKYLVIAWLFVATNVQADGPRYKLSKDEFLGHLKAAVQSMPELKPLWETPASDRAGVYLGGGILRSVMRWLDREIRSAESAGRSFVLGKVPRIAELIPETSDRDLWFDPARLKDRNFLKSKFPGWDFLDEGFYQASVKAGGATLEKFRMTPERVEDPLGAIDAWYNGRLEFHLTTPEELDATRARLKYENTHTVLVLRYLRFLVENPEFRMDADSEKALREIAARETKLPASNWFIEKGIGNLFIAADKKPTRVVEVLSQAGFLDNLKANGYHLDSAKEWSRDLIDFQKMPEYWGDILESSMSHADKVKAIRFLERPQAFPFLMFLTEFQFGRQYDRGLNAFRRYVQEAASLDEIFELMMLKDFTGWKSFSPLYDDLRKRLKGLFAEIPELANLPLKDESLRASWQEILKLANVNESDWPGFSKPCSIEHKKLEMPKRKSKAPKKR